MDSNISFSSEFFFRLALFGAALVIVGVILEAAELMVKIGRKQKHRKWIGEVFGKSYRRKFAFLVTFIHPRILPFEAIGLPPGQRSDSNSLRARFSDRKSVV